MKDKTPVKAKTRRSHQRVSGELAFLVVLVMIVSRTLPGLKDFLTKVELSTQDLRYALRERAKTPTQVPHICVVAIDEHSVQQRAWPWSRGVYSDFVRRMKDYGARGVMFDVLFPEPRDASGDGAFAEAMREAGNVFLGFHGLPASEATTGAASPEQFALEVPQSANWKHYAQFVPPLPLLGAACAGAGHIETQADPDDKYRRSFLFAIEDQTGRAYPHVALEVACHALGLDNSQITYDPDQSVVRLGAARVVPVDLGCRALLNYPGGSDDKDALPAFSRYSFAEVEAGRVSAEKFRDQIVLVGATAPGLYDLKPQPMSRKFFGVETNATLIHNLLKGNFLRETSWLVSSLLVLIVGAIIGLIVPRLPPIPGGLFALGLTLAYLGFSHYQFVAHNFVLDVVPQVLTIVLGFATITAYRVATEEREKRKVRDTFSLYVSPDVVEEILEDPDRINLEGDARELTVLFSDIVGFTSMSEQLPAKEVVRLLNEYFSMMSDIIFDHQGTIDKFIGDAIMVLFNAPKEQPDHPELGVRCALAMRQGLKQLQEHWSAQGRAGFGIGVGINTGEAVVGNLGSPTRMGYTAIGDHVNLASRLEGLTRSYAAEIIISGSTHQRLAGACNAREIDRVVVKGRSEPVAIYEVLEFHTPETFPNMPQVLEHFSAGIEQYYGGEWNAALIHFREALKLNPEDTCSRMYVTRCKQLLAEPPDHWDGVWVMGGK